MSSFHEAYPAGGGRGLFAPEPASHIDAIVLTAGVAYVHAIPPEARWAVFSFTHDVFVRIGGPAVSVSAPTATSTDGGAGELNPAARRIPQAATHIALAAPDACIGAIAFYR